MHKSSYRGKAVSADLTDHKEEEKRKRERESGRELEVKSQKSTVFSELQNLETEKKLKRGRARKKEIGRKRGEWKEKREIERKVREL